MRQYLLGWVGVAGLVALGVSACGSRDNLFVEADEAPGSGGTIGHGGSANIGGASGFGTAGHGGKPNGGASGSSFGGFGNVGGTGFAGVGGTGFGGFAGSGFGGAGGISVGGFAGAGGAFDCSLCAEAGASPCFATICDMKARSCERLPQNDGQPCKVAGQNACIAAAICENGQCIETQAITCPMLGECMSSSCDPNSGQCVPTPLTGTPCTSTDPCTINQCLSGMCAKSSPLTTCTNNDKCCPANCNSQNDNDCPVLPTQITLTATDRGWYDNNGGHQANNKNTFTGFSPPAPTLYNSFFVFDLSSVTRTITGAQLSLEVEHYYGVQMSETTSVWDVTTPAAQVSNGFGVPIFQDLQSGTEYGNFIVTPTAVGQSVQFPLNGKAVADLNVARGRTFAIGLHEDKLSGETSADEGIRFSAQEEPEPNQLILTVQ